MPHFSVLRPAGRVRIKRTLKHRGIHPAVFFGTQPKFPVFFHRLLIQHPLQQFDCLKVGFRTLLQKGLRVPQDPVDFPLRIFAPVMVDHDVPVRVVRIVLQIGFDPALFVFNGFDRVGQRDVQEFQAAHAFDVG